MPRCGSAVRTNKLGCFLTPYAHNSLQFGATEETEAQKLLYYYPEAEPLDRKMLQVGLAEALGKFTRCVCVRA